MSISGLRLFPMILAAILACGSPAHAAYGQRAYTDLHPQGWRSSKAVCVNALGDVAGFGMTSMGQRGFLWSAGRHAILLPPGASSSTVSWVNSRGDVAGTAFDATGTPHAFLFREGEYVDPTPGWAHSEALYVGEDGAVTGRGELGGFVADGGRIAIPSEFTAVVSRTSAGVLLGKADNVVLLYVPGEGNLNLYLPGGDSPSPGRVNEKGLATFSAPVGGQEKGCVYAGGFIIFMTPPGWLSSRAASINGLSEVAGSGDSPNGRRGFLRIGSEYEEIAYPGWVATEAESVNDLGQVAGSGETGSGETHAFLSSPASLAAITSDPGSGGLVAAGGGCGMTPGRDAPFTGTGILSILVLLSPLAYLSGRSLRRKGITPR
jgi:probable HAF family extracellular repeat protein